MSWEREDVVIATDPFKDDESAGRPFLVISTDETPFHPEQYIPLALTTRTWHDERLPLEDDHWLDGGAPEASSIMPWSVNAVKTEWIDYRQGTLREDSWIERLTMSSRTSRRNRSRSVTVSRRGPSSTTRRPRRLA